MIDCLGTHPVEFEQNCQRLVFPSEAALLAI